MTWLSQILSNSVRGCAIGGYSRGSGFGVSGFAGGGPGDRDAFAAIVFATALGDARRLAPAAAQVIQLRAPHRAAAHHLDRADARRVERKDALDPLAVGDLAQGEVRVDPGVLAGDAHPLKGLDPLALAFDDPDADLDRVAWLERRDGPIGRELGDLLGFELLQQIHWSTSCLLSLTASSIRLACAVAPPQIGPAFPGQTLRLGPSPAADPSVIARHQYLGHCPALPDLRPGVVRVFEQPLGKTLLRQRLGATHDPGQQPHAGVDQRDRRRLAARQDKIAEAHLLDRP